MLRTQFVMAAAILGGIAVMRIARTKEASGSHWFEGLREFGRACIWLAALGSLVSGFMATVKFHARVHGEHYGAAFEPDDSADVCAADAAAEE